MKNKQDINMYVLKQLEKANEKYRGLPILAVMNILHKAITKFTKLKKQNVKKGN